MIFMDVHCLLSSLVNVGRTEIMMPDKHRYIARLSGFSIAHGRFGHGLSFSSAILRKL
ncbi:protein of unknown function [Methylocaldum szegediense]|uniref:Uncharacterized protein n=1 Tax=Methylocaldum szegediense TaxID=73780 RepID=A0ABM9I9F1_9GAMM|nr:protein of unknown function [Methylocaldum szegediense]